MSTDPAEFAFVFPGDPDTPTGGFVYGRRVVAECRNAGAAVETIALPAGFPAPSSEAMSAAEAALAGQPDGRVVVVDGLAFGVLPELASRHAGRLRLVALVHHPLADETGLFPAEAARLRQSEAAALASARRVIVTSDYTRDRLAGYGIAPERCRVVEPGIDFAPVRRSCADARGPVRLLCVGSLTPRKGQVELLRALSRSGRSDWVLDIVGPIDRDIRYAEQVSKLAKQMKGEVRFHGAVPERAIGELLEQADVFVSAAWYEGYGMALAEAAMRGLPLVAVAGGAAPFTPAGRAARLVPSGDTAALAEALVRVIADPDERARLADRSREARADMRDWPETGRRFLTALEGV